MVSSTISREGIIKHSSTYDRAPDRAVAEYDPDRSPSLEAQIIDLADEIAYNNHDIDDGLKAGYIRLNDLDEIPLWGETYARVQKKFSQIDRNRQIYQTISHLIGTLIDDLVRTSSQMLLDNGIRTAEEVRAHTTNLVNFSSTMRKRNNELKHFLYHKLYRHYKVERMRVKAEHFLQALFDSFQRTPSLLPDDCQTKIAIYGKERTICDYIAGMTDRYAMDEYKRLFDPYERV
ncbi:MAG: hypothetical protein P8X63_06870 [Desulfuromonadaceae bacterium]